VSVEIIFNWYVLIYPVAMVFGIALHEPAHFVAAKLAGASNIKMGLTKEGDGYLRYDLKNLSRKKIRVIGLAPILAAFIIVGLNVIGPHRLEWYCVAFGLVVYTSWSDLSVNIALGQDAKIKQFYHSIPKYVRLFVVACFFWQITNLMVYSLGGRGVMASVVEIGGQLTALFTAYYAAYIMIFDPSRD
tara:strand:+ start:901 stop:1464 length:564 start_codon:yes stop_codon:yes gene_type:complete